MGYSGVFVFGDSLVDPGNALKLAKWYGGLPLTDLPEEAPTPDKGYFEGRFSDGYTFADLISNKAVGVVTKPVFPYGFDDPWIGLPVDPFAGDPSGNNLNFAYGGSHIRQGDEVVPDLDGQTDAFKDAVDGDADPNALYLFTTGGNDVRDLALTGEDPVPPELAYAELQACADKLFREISQLIEIGAKHVVITGIPDVGLIPRYDRDGNLVLDPTEQMRADAATEYSLYLDELIRTEVVPALQALGATVTYVPIMDYVNDQGVLVTGALNANLQTIADLHGITLEELTGNWLEHQKLVFFDQIHPNAQANALLGAYMQAQISGLPWVETPPLLAADVDYGAVGSIAVAGEVDRLSIAMIAGTTYTFQALGVSTVTPFVLSELGIAAPLGGTILADPRLSLLAANGATLVADDDSGIGFDSTLAYSVASAGTYTLAVGAVGSLTGSYVLTATVTGAAMQAGNTYTVNNAATLVLEGEGGIGVDVVKASVSYALAGGSEVEVLRTGNDKGKTAIDLTGNEFGQTIVGNAGANRIEGKGGADTLTGGAGKDVFVLSNAAITDPGAGNVDAITDYGTGDVVDISQILAVAADTNVLTGGYLRVTKSGLVQVDTDGGGDEWATLSTINGSAAVTVRYLSGGKATDISAARVADSQLRTASAANGNIVLIGSVAAAGMLAAPAAAETSIAPVQTVAVRSADWLAAQPIEAAVDGSGGPDRWALAGESREAVEESAASPVRIERDSSADAIEAVETAAAPSLELSAGTDMPGWNAAAIAAETVAMPPAEMLQAAAAEAGAGVAGEARGTAEVGRVVAEALSAGDSPIDAMLDALADGPRAAIEALAAHAPALRSWDPGHEAMAAVAIEAPAFHPDAAAPA